MMHGQKNIKLGYGVAILIYIYIYIYIYKISNVAYVSYNKQLTNFQNCSGLIFLFFSQ